MKNTQTLLFLAQIDPLRNVPLSDIQGIEKVGDFLKIKVINRMARGAALKTAKPRST